MPKPTRKLAWFLLVIQMACLDYQEPFVIDALANNFPPIIDHRFISPSSSALSEGVRMGDATANDCKIEFKIPPIRDQNTNDKLYFTWLFDGSLLENGTIEPEFRRQAVSTLAVTRNILETHYSGNLPANFFDKGHVIEFFVADRPYLIAEQGVLTDPAGFESKVSWQVRFFDHPC